MRAALMFVALGAIACRGNPDADPDDTAPPGDVPAVAPSVHVTWSGSQVASTLEVEIDDPAGRTSWSFGMAETEAGEAGWYGEDCFVGLGAYTHCHAFEGDTLVLQRVRTPAEVESGESTLFWPGMNLTYVLDDGDDCWVWGHDPSYYDPLGCELLEDATVVWAARDGCSGMDPHDPAPLGGRVALTFDDGPHPTRTPRILATLREYGVPATFFMLGVEAADPAVEAIIEDIAADPLFTIGNHSWGHPDLALMSLDDVRDEIDDTNQLLATFTGEIPRHFRFPYGDSTCATADLVRQELGQVPTGWHVDTADWCYASDGVCTRDEYWRIPPGHESDMIAYVLEQVRAFDGGVLLLHDIHAFTADSLEDLILTLQGDGFTFTSLDDASAFPRLVADDPYPFPWVGAPCDTEADTCWQVEWNAWCEPTGAPGVPPTAGLCVLPCERASDCVDRDGSAPLACVDVDGAGVCLAESTLVNGSCADYPGAVEVERPHWPSGGAVEVCLPHAWQP